ncbi:C1 family peptidase [Mycoplasma sp. ES3157-GEN-MYC]|uniref:C1 family peptidase n=1 Tax=Mycoplasma miroungigenitalium TaxID=754515 RepID=UPI001C11C6DD|nr:C1 family peptidase [Mycoplasma miroungigenitalium]MBU4690699.1 C1 family peptidase [Mycoplasma miroungigenitalium]
MIKKIKKLFFSKWLLPLVSTLPLGVISASFSHDQTDILPPKTLEELRKANPYQLSKLKRFDSRDYGIVTSVKNQESQDICWSYAQMSAAETNILLKGLYVNQDDKELDLNEKNFAYYHKNRGRNIDYTGLTTDDITKNVKWDSAEHSLLSGLTLFNWNSPIIQVDSKNDLFNEKNQEPIAKITDLIQLDRDNISDIKMAVAKYGSATISWKGLGETGKFINHNDTDTDHVSTIIGWDDDVAKENFSQQPIKNGAWIIKNSWGTHFHDQGFAYISYELPIRKVYSYNYVSSSKYDNLYHYDGMSLGVESPNGEKISKAANIFPVLNNLPDRKEYLKAINVAFQSYDEKPSEFDVSVKIYNNIKANKANPKDSINNPIDESKLVVEQTKHFRHGGVRTIELDKEIELVQGQYFSVVVEVKNSANNAVILWSNEKSTNDLSYYYLNGKWENGLIGANDNYSARIKAYTVNKAILNTSVVKDLKYSRVLLEQNVLRHNKDTFKSIPKVYYGGKLLRYKYDYDFTVEEHLYGNKGSNYHDNNIIGYGVVKVKGLGEYGGGNENYYGIKVGLNPDLTNIPNSIFDYENKILYIQTDKNIDKFGDLNLTKFGLWWSNPDQKIHDGFNTEQILKYTGADVYNLRQTYFRTVLVKNAPLPIVKEIDQSFNALWLEFRDVDKIKSSVIPINISNANIILENNSFEYVNKELTPKVSIELNGLILTRNTDFIVEYENNKNAGIGTIKIIGIGKFEGVIYKNFTINKSTPYLFYVAVNKNFITAKNDLDLPVIFEFYSDSDAKNKISQEDINKLDEFYIRARIEPTENTNIYISNLLHIEKIVYPLIVKPNLNDSIQNSESKEGNSIPNKEVTDNPNKQNDVSDVKQNNNNKVNIIEISDGDKNKQRPKNSNRHVLEIKQKKVQKKFNKNTIIITSSAISLIILVLLFITIYLKTKAKNNRK